MPDWQAQLSAARQEAINREKKQAQERRDSERAKRMQEENRMLLARRLLYAQPEPRIQTREPVNRMAARLLWKAPDFAKPPESNKQQQKGKQPMAVKGTLGETTVERNDQNFPGAKTASGTPMPSNSGIPRDHNIEDYFNIHDVAVRIIDEINRQPHQLTALARAAIDAREVLDENMKQIGPLMEGFNARVKVALEDVRQSRMAVIGEVTHLLQPLKEVRAFLLGKDYEFEIARLKEFCDLCERLAKLKKDGTLDAIADTIIKLA